MNTYIKTKKHEFYHFLSDNIERFEKDDFGDFILGEIMDWWIAKLLAREKELYAAMEEKKAILIPRRDRVKKQYDDAYRRWFEYNDRDLALKALLESFESGTNGHILAEVSQKIDTISDMQSLLIREVKE